MKSKSTRKKIFSITLLAALLLLFSTSFLSCSGGGGSGSGATAEEETISTDDSSTTTDDGSSATADDSSTTTAAGTTTPATGDTTTASPTDANGDGDYTDPDDDFDGDGIINSEDTDDDNDGVTNTTEATLGTDAYNADSDGDGISDGDEASTTFNQVDADGDNDYTGPDDDFDGDGIINSEDTDDDNDGISDAAESSSGSDPFDADSDDDGISDGADADLDSDGDGTANSGEAVWPTAENIPVDANGNGDFTDAGDDFDGDGVVNSTDTDDDNDGVSDGTEVTLGTDPTLEDSNGDGVSDGNEVGTDGNIPLDANGDGDFNDPADDLDGDGIVNSADTDFTTALTYTITYNSNGATSGVEPYSSTKTENINLFLSYNSGLLSKTGYTFSGWNSAASGTGTDYSEGSKYTANASITLYAKWTANDYEITFNEQSGSGPDPATKTVTYDSSYGTLATTTRTGYTFEGWYTGTDGSGSKITAASTVAVTADTTLYADWTINAYTVSFDSQDGSAVGDQSINYGGKVTEPSDPAKEGSSFAGWYTDTGYGTAWNFSTDTVTSSKTLYAKWNVNSYTVSFDSQGGSDISDQSVEYGGTATEPADPTKDGSSFAGWYTDTNYNTAWDFSSVTISAATTIYAKWSDQQTYTVTYYKSGSENGDAPTVQTKEQGTDLPLASTAGSLVLTGYTFTGWNTQADGNGTAYAAGATYSTEADIDLYAQWSAASFNVTFDADDTDASGSMSAQSITFGQSANLTSNSFTQTGHSFGGWSTTSGGSAAYSDGASYTMNSEGATLYAVWTINDYTVTFDANGGEGSMSAQTITFGQSADLSSNSFSYSGKKFSGWSTASDGSVDYSDSASYTMDTEGTTLYAIWEDAILETIAVTTTAGSTVAYSDYNASGVQYKATGHYDNGDDIDITNQVSWSSDNSDVIIMNSAGLGTLQYAGSTIITATSGSIDGSTSLAVTHALTAIAISPETTVTLDPSDTQNFTATGTYDDGITGIDVTDSVSWVVGDGTYATFTNSTLTAVAQGSTYAKATSGSINSESVTVNVNAASATSISISADATSVANNGTVNFTASVNYNDGTTLADATSSVTWSIISGSDNGSIGASTGTFTASSSNSGSVTVQAAIDSVTATFGVTVAVELERLEITPTTKSVPKGESQQFTATAIYSDFSSLDVTASCTWSLDPDGADTGTASIGSATGLLSTASGDTAGTVTVNAVFTDGTTATADVTVSSADLSAILVTPSSADIFRGTNQQFTATAYYTDGSTIDVTDAATWSIAATDYTDLDITTTKGLLTTSTGSAAQSVEVSATYNYYEGTSSVTIKSATIESIDVTPKNAISYGTTQQYVATGTFSDGNTKDITTSVSWSSSVEERATIDASGLATAVSTDESIPTVISATLNSITGSTNLYVYDNELNSLSFVPSAAFTMEIGTTQQMHVNGTYDDTTVQELTDQVVWSCENTDGSETPVLAISNVAGSKGIVTALKGGTAKITAQRTGQREDGTYYSVPGTTSYSITVASDSVAPSLLSSATLTTYGSDDAVAITFDEAMDVASVIGASYTITGSAIDVDSVVAISTTDYLLVLDTTDEALDSITYTLSISGTLPKDVANNSLDTSNDTASFVGKDTIAPYILSVSNTSGTKIEIVYSEPMTYSSTEITTNADEITNYTLVNTTDSTPVDLTDGCSVDAKDDSTYVLTLKNSVDDNDTYTISVAATVTDQAATPNTMGDPSSQTFIGNEQLKVVNATATDVGTIKITFNKAIEPTTAGHGESTITALEGIYSIVPKLDDNLADGFHVTSASVSGNTVTITHQEDQGGQNYTIACNGIYEYGYASEAGSDDGRTISADTYGDYLVQDAPKDRASFVGAGGAVTSPADGPQFEDPFGDSTASGFSFIYNDKVFVGPNGDNSTLVRFDPDGGNVTQIDFLNKYYSSGWIYYAENDATYGDRLHDFGHESTDVNGGPEGVDGVGYFSSVNLNGKEYLVAGVQDLNVSMLGQIFLSCDTGTTMEFFSVGVHGPNGVKSTSAVYGDGTRLYVGMASNHGVQEPSLNIITVASDNTSSSYTEWSGWSALRDETGGSAKDIYVSGIDTIAGITDGSNDYVLIANAVAMMISSTSVTPDQGNFVNIEPSAFNRNGTTSTRLYDELKTYQPHERGIPAIVQYGNDIYVARNRSTIVDNGSGYVNDTRLTPELWKGTFSGDPVNGTWTWERIIGLHKEGVTYNSVDYEYNDFGTTLDSSIDAISLLELNGDKLYVGMDSTSAGAFLYCFDLSGDSPYGDGTDLENDYDDDLFDAADFTSIGRVATSGAPSGYNGTAFGGDANIQRFYSSQTVEYNGNYYLYMSAGGEDSTGDEVPMRVFRQIDAGSSALLAYLLGTGSGSKVILVQILLVSIAVVLGISFYHRRRRPRN